MKQFDVLGVRVSAINIPLALSKVAAWVEHHSPNYVCVTGVHGVMESQRDASLRSIHNAAGMVTPDGMPLVWLGKLAGHKQIDRVYGPDLMLAVSEESVKRGWKHFYYGGSEGVADLLRDRLVERFPGLQVVGSYCPPFRQMTNAEDDQVVELINDSGADLVWVGLSTPKQERWMYEHVGRLRASAIFGVGAAFDFHAGLKSQAPRCIQRSGMEWLFRLCTEPRRLWKRYLRNNPEFVLRIIAQKLSSH